nr:unnamed protein product [Callosobruchus chinensis]
MEVVGSCNTERLKNAIKENMADAQTIHRANGMVLHITNIDADEGETKVKKAVEKVFPGMCINVEVSAIRPMNNGDLATTIRVNKEVELENDVWGAGYKIVIRHLKEQYLPFKLTLEQRSEIIGHLFPTTKNAWQRRQVVTEGVTPFSKAELDEAADHNIKTGKAPGPNHIPPEIVKIAVKEDTNDIMAAPWEQDLINMTTMD